MKIVDRWRRAQIRNAMNERSPSYLEAAAAALIQLTAVKNNVKYFCSFARKP